MIEFDVNLYLSPPDLDAIDAIEMHACDHHGSRTTNTSYVPLIDPLTTSLLSQKPTNVKSHATQASPSCVASTAGSRVTRRVYSVALHLRRTESYRTKNGTTS